MGGSSSTPRGARLHPRPPSAGLARCERGNVRNAPLASPDTRPAAVTPRPAQGRGNVLGNAGLFSFAQKLTWLASRSASGLA